MTIGERIKLKRMELGWSQVDLAKKMGYSDRSAIAMVETGRRDVTQTNVIRYALGKDVEAKVYSHRTMEQLRDEIEKIIVT